MLRLAAFAAAFAVQPAAAPDFVQWHTHLGDAYAIARSERLRIAVDGRFAISGACHTGVVAQRPAPGVVPADGVIRLRASASCRASTSPGTAAAPQVVGRDAATAIPRLTSWGDNWSITFPRLPATRAADLYDPYRIARERFQGGVLRLDAELVPAVVHSTCPIFGLDTSPAYDRPATKHDLRAAAADAIGLVVARRFVSKSDVQPPGPMYVSARAAERLGSCVEDVVTVRGAWFQLPRPELIPPEVKIPRSTGIVLPAAGVQVVIGDASRRVLTVLRVDR